MNRLTKKLNGKRVMKKIDVWFGLNKTTPDQWFLRWSFFIDALFIELGFDRTGDSLIQKKHGKEWVRDLHYNHSILGEYCITLKRKRKETGGTIWVLTKDKGSLINTVSSPKIYSYDIMSRTEVGNKILENLRENWTHENTSNEKS